MKKMINIRNSVIIILCVTIICMALGFIVISMELKNEKSEKETFDVVFTKMVKSSSVKGSSVEPVGSGEVDENGKVLHMNFQLNAVHDELIYLATIQNKGTLPAKIVDIMESPNYKKESMAKLIQPVTIQLSDLENKILQPNEEVELKITVYYNPTTAAVTPRAVVYDLGLLTESVTQ